MSEAIVKLLEQNDWQNIRKKIAPYQFVAMLVSLVIFFTVLDYTDNIIQATFGLCISALFLLVFLALADAGIAAAITSVRGIVISGVALLVINTDIKFIPIGILIVAATFIINDTNTDDLKISKYKLAICAFIEAVIILAIVYIPFETL